MGWHPEAWFQVEILALNFSLYLLANPSGCVSILAINGFLSPPSLWGWEGLSCLPNSRLLTGGPSYLGQFCLLRGTESPPSPAVSGGTRGGGGGQALGALSV